MLRGGWRSYVALGGVALGLLVLTGWGGYALRGYQHEHAEQRESAADYEAPDARKQIKTNCTRVAGARSFECIADVPDADDSEEYTKQDLKAQQDMAEWAFAMFVVTGLAFLLNIVGLYYVVAALRLNATATDAATDANKQNAHQATIELRPYVFVERYIFSAVVDAKNKKRVVCWQWTLVWKNSGPTPAARVRAQLSAKLFATGQAPDSIGFADQGSFDAIGNSIGPGGNLHSRVVLSLADVVAVQAGTHELYYWGWVEYDDGFPESSRHRTEICAKINVLGDPQQLDCQFSDSYSTVFNAFDEACVHKP